MVVANRLPPAGETVVAHLVSLEGLGDQLPNDDGSAPTTRAPWTAIRLVSLKSWSFRVGPLQASFADILTGLNGHGVGDSLLRLPNGYRPTVGTAATPEKPFDSGYTVLGDSRTPSTPKAWYRGPFVPSTVTPPQSDSSWLAKMLPADHAKDLDVPVAAAPTTDSTYSAAWQIGRLIALADKDFATAQVAWKRDCRLKLNVLISQAASTTASSRADYAGLVRGILKRDPKDPKDPKNPTIPYYLGTGLTTDPTATGSLLIPQKLVDWMAKLALLNSVPFHYLAPDSGMLPPESIRFFRVDPQWIAALLDGAWSLGREPKSGWAFDTAYQPWAELQAGRLFPTSRTNPWPASGMLLSSRLIPGYWPGIDFTLDSGSTLREDRIGPNTVLLLFDKPFSSITIQEPPEGIHFGFDMDDTGNLSKTLRSVTIGTASYPSSSSVVADGTEVKGCSLTPIPQRQRSSTVIQLNQLARQMAVKLGIPAVPPSIFTTAEFALELVEGVPAVTFTLPKSS